MIPTIDTWSYPLRLMTAFFLVVLSIGFFTGIRFVSETDSTSPDGLVEHYNGNEQVEDVMVMKFKKSAQEMLTIVHTHILSMSMLFFLTGFLLAQTSINQHIHFFDNQALVENNKIFKGISFAGCGAYESEAQKLI